MKKVTLIGDCHSARLLEHWNPKTCPVDFKSWGKAGTTAWIADPVKMNESKTLSSSTEGTPLYTEDRDSLYLDFSTIKNQDLILVWLGYVDIRQRLGDYKNADECVKNYVQRFVDYFKGTKIRFIEPLPQFIPLLMKFSGLHPEFTYEERMQQNKEFIEALSKYSDEHGLEKPISQQQIFEYLGFGQDEMTSDKTPEDRPHPIDGLLPVHMAKIYNLIIEEASK